MMPLDSPLTINTMKIDKKLFRLIIALIIAGLIIGQIQDQYSL
jgi:hypothetical protein